MFKVYKDNKAIAIVENLVYIKKHPAEDCYILASESDAAGISIQAISQVYALSGKELDGLDQVVVVKEDGGALLDDVLFELNPESEINYALPLETVRERAVKKTKTLIDNKLRCGIEYNGNLKSNDLCLKDIKI